MFCNWGGGGRFVRVKVVSGGGRGDLELRI